MDEPMDYDSCIAVTWSVETVRWTDGGYEATGTCARCGHPTTHRGQHVYAAAAAQPGRQAIPVRCDCGHAHPGRGEDQMGCGAYWSMWEPEART